MRVEHHFKGAFKDPSLIDEVLDKTIKDSMYDISLAIAKKAQEIIETFVNKKGHNVGVDTGEFINGIFNELTDDGYGWKVADTVEYGIWHEFGTEGHWLPFFDRNGEITSLGLWALRNFNELTFTTERDDFKPRKRRKGREEILREIGGITVQLDKMAPFRQALAYGESVKGDIFRRNFNANKKDITRR